MKRNKYSNFVQEKVYDIHESVLTYLDDRGNEEKYWNMQDSINQRQVAIPDQIHDVVQAFINQYLEEDLFGVTCTKKCQNKIDLSKFESLEVKCPQPESDEDYVTWFKLKTIYDAIAMEYIRPVFAV